MPKAERSEDVGTSSTGWRMFWEWVEPEAWEMVLGFLFLYIAPMGLGVGAALLAIKLEKGEIPEVVWQLLLVLGCSPVVAFIIMLLISFVMWMFE